MLLQLLHIQLQLLLLLLLTMTITTTTTIPRHLPIASSHGLLHLKTRLSEEHVAILAQHCTIEKCTTTTSSTSQSLSSLSSHWNFPNYAAAVTTIIPRGLIMTRAGEWGGDEERQAEEAGEVAAFRRWLSFVSPNSSRHLLIYNITRVCQALQPQRKRKCARLRRNWNSYCE